MYIDITKKKSKRRVTIDKGREGKRRVESYICINEIYKRKDSSVKIFYSKRNKTGGYRIRKRSYWSWKIWA